MRFLRRRAARQAVNAFLSSREPLSVEKWGVEILGETVEPSLASFVICHLGSYSGLSVERFRASDRLVEDLRWGDVTYGDWELDLIEDFARAFHVSLVKRLHGRTFHTAGELIAFLVHCARRRPT